MVVGLQKGLWGLSSGRGVENVVMKLIRDCGIEKVVMNVKQ